MSILIPFCVCFTGSPVLRQKPPPRRDATLVRELDLLPFITWAKEVMFSSAFVFVCVGFSENNSWILIRIKKGVNRYFYGSYIHEKKRYL